MHLQLMFKRIFSNRSHTALFFIWVAFVGRGVFYVVALPMWEGFDEYAHFAFAHHLVTEGTLPDPSERVSIEVSESLKLVPLPWLLKDWPAPAVTHDDYWQLPPEERLRRQELLRRLEGGASGVKGQEFLYEAKQPPLYYLLAFSLLRLLRSQTLTTQVYALRLFSILVASLVVPIAYRVACQASSERFALWVAAILTSMPGLIMSVSRVSNDALAVPLFSLLTYFVVRLSSGDSRSWFWTGLTLGAGLLTKAYFVAAIPGTLVMGLLVFTKLRGNERRRYLLYSATFFLATLLIAGWWYVRALISADGAVWVDAGPTQRVPLGSLLGLTLLMDWRNAIVSALGAHIWLGGWSFLGLRSWMYQVVELVFVIAGIGLLRLVFRGASLAVQRVSVLPFLLLYLGFWLALMYHAFINFVNSGTPATTGYYLYAAVVSEIVLLAVGLTSVLPARWMYYGLSALTGLFLLLEFYATHFVALPYYNGLIRHGATGGLAAFYISKASSVGWVEIVNRMLANRPEIVSAGALVAIWLSFIICSLTLMIWPSLAPDANHPSSVAR